MSEEKKSSSKLILFFNELEYDRKYKKAVSEIEAIEQGLEIAAQLLGRDLSLSESSAMIENPRTVLTNLLSSGVKIEGLSLSPSKILELKEINIEPCVSVLDPLHQYARHVMYNRGKWHFKDTFKAELKEQFTTFAETAKEEAIATVTLRIIESWQQLQELTELPLNYRGLTEATYGLASIHNGRPIVGIHAYRNAVQQRIYAEEQRARDKAAETVNA